MLQLISNIKAETSSSFYLAGKLKSTRTGTQVGIMSMFLCISNQVMRNFDTDTFIIGTDSDLTEYSGYRAV